MNANDQASEANAESELSSLLGQKESLLSPQNQTERAHAAYDAAVEKHETGVIALTFAEEVVDNAEKVTQQRMVTLTQLQEQEEDEDEEEDGDNHFELTADCDDDLVEHSNNEWPSSKQDVRMAASPGSTKPSSSMSSKAQRTEFIQLLSPVQQQIAQRTALVTQLAETQQPSIPAKPPPTEVAVSPNGVTVTPVAAVAAVGNLTAPEGRGMRATRVKVESISPPREWGEKW